MPPRKLDLLRRNEILKGFPDPELEELLGICAVAKLPAGKTLVKQGEAAKGMFLLASGEVEVLMDEPGQEPLRLKTMGAGEVVGELSLIDGKPASATVSTTRASVVYRLERKGLMRLREQQRPVAYALLRRLASVVCKRLRQITDRTRHGARGLPQESLPESAAEDTGALSSSQRRAVARQRHFRDLSPQELAPVLDIMRARELQKGGLLFREGDPGWACYLVLSGGIEVLVDRGGVMEGLVVLRRGTLLGQVAVFDGGVRSATCRANEATLVVELGRPRFDELLDSRSPGAWRLMEALLEVLSGQLRRATEQLRRLEMKDRRRNQGRSGSVRQPKGAVDVKTFMRRARAGLGDFDLDAIEVANNSTY